MKNIIINKFSLLVILVCCGLSSCHNTKSDKVRPMPVTPSGATGELISELGFTYSSLDEAESKLVAKLDSLYGDEGDRYYYFNEELLSLVSHDPATLTHDFSKMQEKGYVDIETSDDGNLRIYYWDTGMGGTCIDWGNICQFRSNDKVYVCDKGFLSCIKKDGKTEESDFECAINDIHTVVANNGEVYYLVWLYFRESSNWGLTFIETIKIEDGKLISVPLFEDSEETAIEYQIADWYFRANEGEGWDWTHCYDKQTGTLYIPKLEDASISDRYYLYTFNGEKFEFLREDSGFWLYPEIRDYKYLEVLFCTSDYRIRIDKMNDDTYRYTSWKKDVSMGQKPDIVIYNGQFDENNYTYTFENSGFKYCINNNEYNEHTLTVINNSGKQILYQKQKHEY